MLRDLLLYRADRTDGFRPLIEVPFSGGAANREIVQLAEGFVGEIDGISLTTHAFVDHSCRGGLSSCVTGDCYSLAAVRVAV